MKNVREKCGVMSIVAGSKRCGSSSLLLTYHSSSEGTAIWVPSAGQGYCVFPGTFSQHCTQALHNGRFFVLSGASPRSCTADGDRGTQASEK